MKSSDFSVNVEDYFNPSCKTRFLHFFQWRSKNLHIISLDNLKKLRGEAKFETIPLSIDFEIPDYHNSLITPDGEIYLTGGQDPKDLNKKFREVYAVSFAKKTLIQKSSMITPRDSHALCYFKGHLYVIGGITINSQGKKTVTNKCEKYNIKDNKWQEIADLTLPVCNHSATVFQNKYIFCFGGRLLPNKLSNNILRYSLDKDEWLKIEVRPQIQTQNKLSLTSQATCYQINEGQIFIFGGYQADRNISSQSFLFEYCAASNDVELKPKSSLKEDMEENKSFLNFSSKENERKKGSGKRPPRKKEGGITGKKDICIIKGLNKKNLPHAAPFWDKQVIVDKGKIYCLQNVTMPNDPKLSYSTTRRILVFDGEKWTSLN